MLCVGLLTIVVMVVPSYQYSLGPPPTACSDMFPFGHGANAQTMAPPFDLTVHTPVFQELSRISVTITARTGHSFMGIYVQARSTNCSIEAPVGSFLLNTGDPTIKLTNCNGGINNTISHTNSRPKAEVAFFWEAPMWNVGPIYIRATVVQSFTVFWPTLYSTIMYPQQHIALKNHMQCPVRVSLDATQPLSLGPPQTPNTDMWGNTGYNATTPWNPYATTPYNRRNNINGGFGTVPPPGSAATTQTVAMGIIALSGLLAGMHV